MKHKDDMPARLYELNGSNFEIASGQEDITGWEVKDAQRNKIGKVDDLVFSKESMKVRYMILNVKKNKDIGLEHNRKVLVPIGTAQLDKEDDEVILPNMTVNQLEAMPDYDKDMLDYDMETKTYNAVTGRTAVATGGDFYNDEIFNDRNLYRNRPQNRMSETNYDKDQDRYRDENKNEETTIPVIKENFEVGKKEEETGGIRIHKRVVEQPVEKKVHLRKEHIKVDRKNVDRPATDSDFDNLKDQDIEVTEHSEVPVVNKEARVVEEVRVKKEVSENEETVKDSVRNTEVHIDDLEPDDEEHK